MRRFWTTPERPLDEVPLEQLSDLPVEDRLERLEKNDATTVVERRRIIGLQRSQLAGVLSLVLLLVVLGFFYGKHIDSNTKALRHTNGVASHAQTVAQRRTSEAQTALRASQIQACKRSNERTVDENLSHLDDFQFDRRTANLFSLALTQPHAPNPALTPAQERHDAGLLHEYIGHLHAIAAHKTWKHLIGDCEGSVDHPGEYHLGPAIRFAKHMPPKGALEIRPGE